jgi:hypothetical protein
MSLRRTPIAAVFRLCAGLLLLSQGGCMSALTTAAMREALRETVDSLAAAAATDQDADVSASLATDAARDEATPLISEPKAPSLDESVDRAVARLKGVGELDAPTQATLLSILEKTSPEDWPAAIDAFAASLEAYRPPKRTPAVAASTARPVATTASAPSASLVFPASGTTDGAPSSEPTPEPPATALVFDPPAALEAAGAAIAQVDTALAFPAPPAIPEPAKLAFIEAARPVGPEPYPVDDGEAVLAPLAILEPLKIEEPVAFPEPPAALEPSVAATSPEVVEPVMPVMTVDDPAAVEPAEPTVPPVPMLAVRNACFVSRVRAWGVVDKFPEAVFRAGQDVIVYFELEAPTTRRSPAGHTTSIDTIFRLFDSDGRQVGQWDFEPIEETCLAPRRDYFARYFVRIPETAASGPYRLELMVTDLVAGVSSQAHLDLEVRQ